MKIYCPNCKIQLEENFTLWKESSYICHNSNGCESDFRLGFFSGKLGRWNIKVNNYNLYSQSSILNIAITTLSIPYPNHQMIFDIKEFFELDLNNPIEYSKNLIERFLKLKEFQ
jgi:hypothetical protein